MGLDLSAAQWVVFLPSMHDGLHLILNNPKLTNVMAHTCNARAAEVAKKEESEV